MICAQNDLDVTLGSLSFVRHLKNVHNICTEDYHFLHVLKRTGNDSVLCKCGCERKVAFINLVRGYQEYATNHCGRASYILQDEERNNRRQTLREQRGIFALPESVEHVSQTYNKKERQEFICKICNMVSMKENSLGHHLVDVHHISKEDYYLLFELGLNELIYPLCECGCGRKTEFLGIYEGHRQFYSVKCSVSIDRESTKFRREHRGMSRVEWTLWENPTFKSLLPKRGKGFHYEGGISVPDFYFENMKLAVELDGGSHRYTKELDQEKEEGLKKLGWVILRFKNEEVLNNVDLVVNKIQETMVDIVLTEGR